jgi:serine/threonine-protein kinase RsbT
MNVSKQYLIAPNDYFNAGSASSDIKKTLKSMNFSNDLIKRISIASYEAEINIVIHSYGGFVDFKVNDTSILIQCVDSGPGIDNVELAMSPGFSTASETVRLNGFGAGMGLPNIKNSCDELTIVSDPNGTIVTMSFHRVEVSQDDSV